MTTLTNLFAKNIGNIGRSLVQPTTSLAVCYRFASKKVASSGGLKNAGNSIAKHRGWKKQDGHTVQKGNILATQNKTRWHPGLNVGFGKNGTLFAMIPGKVVVSCEEVDLNWNISWNKSNYANREGQKIYKKHFNVIPEPEHKRFKLIDKI